MPIYNKLVRDRIPEIIANTGKLYTSRILDESEYITEVNKKMGEELTEYLETTTAEDAIEELADILELIHAAAAHHGSTFEELNKVRVEKAKKRGGFNERIFLVEVEDD
ncbi:nucleoside triphosphate pyrophosphohydrolase [Sporosarcina oncorhynchi]|uniref:Nucleoside triphosphate pyrophosphohydrolase n=1 Tax=Sporosarcina oncorhynchi TaxID=3056444 RepID=A0ABZ0L2X6_9BACL|nr:nucleoside triphosphate pyrophosphohydrolase [Sporosarcina sp. T2O-4]WOV86964.1 nucleoside triphosphate pyrophosphohydrolase [Sporosarcina sp. T2O-4]